VLTSEYDAATEAKMKCQMEADKTALTIDLANRLVGGLSAEKSRWIQNVHKYYCPHFDTLKTDYQWRCMCILTI